MTRYIEHSPPADLAAIVESLWSLRGAFEANRSPERVVPDGCIELIFHAGNPFARIDDTRDPIEQPRAFVVGQLTRVLLLQPGPVVDVFGIRLRPGGARRVLHLPLDELSDRAVPIEEIWGSVGAKFSAALLEAVDERARVSIAVAFVRKRVAERAPSHASFRRAIDAIVHRRGQIRIERLAHEVGWSVRQLERTFVHDLGLTPKQMGRIVRLNALLERIRGGAPGRWADLALELGFADQSHLIREFRTLVGVSPTAPDALDGAMTANFTSARRLSGYFACD